jgi:hypothetical protein
MAGKAEQVAGQRRTRARIDRKAPRFACGLSCDSTDGGMGAVIRIVRALPCDAKASGERDVLDGGSSAG